MGQCLGGVAAPQRHHARQRQGFGLIRLRGQRLRHGRDRIGVRYPLIGRQQGVGQVSQHGGLAGNQAQHLLPSASSGALRSRCASALMANATPSPVPAAGGSTALAMTDTSAAARGLPSLP
ncbi:hypothetical protein G6F24_015809 [Rhizopus arrhizus]|nr:hypothetical protein G6F24_015809 [Rhizopus arrhizus]